MGETDKKTETVLRGKSVFTNEPIEVLVQNGKIHEVKRLDCGGEGLPYIGPGLVDLQINGYGGIDFNTLPLTVEDVIKATRMILENGVTSFFPTVITNHARKIEELLQVIAKACTMDQLTNSVIKGIHLEGPFISRDQEAKGAHDLRYIKEPNWAEFIRWQEAANGKIKIITVAPEWDNVPSFIRKCKASGIIVSIGHSNATAREVKEAILAGATMSTHLGNGVPTMLRRHPNLIWEQLAADELKACVIADGFHLPMSVLKVFTRAKGKNLMLVSDAVYLAGMKPGKYLTHIGGEVTLTKERKLHLSSNPNLLAGSVQMLKEGIMNLLTEKISTLKEAWEMAANRPAAFVGLDGVGGIEIGYTADLVTFGLQGERIIFREIYKHGERII